MKKTILAINLLFVLVAVFPIASTQAKTVTQGTINVEEVTKTLRSELNNFANKKSSLTRKIKKNRVKMANLKKRYNKQNDDAKKMEIKSKQLKAVSQYLKNYSKVYSLAINKVKEIMPKVRKLKKGAKRLRKNQINQAMKDPKFKKLMRNYYGTLSTLALNSKDKSKRKLVANLLKREDKLTSNNLKNQKSIDKLLKNLDHLEGSLMGLYAKAQQGARKFKTAKKRTQMSIKMFKFIMGTKATFNMVKKINIKQANLPEINISQHIQSPFLDNSQDTSKASDADTKAILKKYQRKGSSIIQ